MRTVTFKSVLYGAAAMAGLSDPASQGTLSSARAADLTAYLNERVREAREWEWWPELMLTEQRRYRDTWLVGTSYAAPTASAAVEVWYAPAQAYYQTLRAPPAGTVPATLSGAEYEAAEAYWAECADSYSGDDWATTESYAVGDTVRRPDDDRFYLCHTAHVSGATFDTTKFGILTPFNRYIAFDQTSQTKIGHVKGLFRNDPRVFPRNPRPVDFAPNTLGYAVDSTAPDQVWMQFRRKGTDFTTTAWASATTYAIGDVVYLASTGECYEATAASTNQTPPNTTYWEKVDFPKVFSGFVKRSVCADVLKDQKQNSRGRDLLQAAYGELQDAVERELPQQEQYATATTVGFR